jgi:hypothetical protein
MYGFSRLKIALIFIGVMTLVHSVGGTLLAQSGNDVKNALDNRLRRAARVDPVTLTMQLNLNLGTYPGRAGTSEPLVPSYTSKQWEVEYLVS